MPVAFCSPVPISLMAKILALPLPSQQPVGMKVSRVGARFAFKMPWIWGDLSMLRRHLLATAAASFAAPAIVSRSSLGQNLRKVKMGSAFTTTTNAAFLMPDILKAEGIDLELVMFPSLVQRMQAVA